MNLENHTMESITYFNTTSKVIRWREFKHIKAPSMTFDEIQMETTILFLVDICLVELFYIQNKDNQYMSLEYTIEIL